MNPSEIIRPAKQSDRRSIERFLIDGIAMHRHLDWRLPIEWLGKSPFLLFLNTKNNIKAIINCAPEPEDVFWIRLFACRDPSKISLCWNKLFPEVLQRIANLSDSPTLASLAYHEWMIELLEIEGWSKAQKVIQMKWDHQEGEIPANNFSNQTKIRRMIKKDIQEVSEIDQLCFTKIWQLSFEAFKHAFDQSEYATVFEMDQEIYGFQFSTKLNKNAHLARIAVHPQFQHRGIGENLTRNMLHYFLAQGIYNISVNTQESNVRSINMYEKLKFKKTGSTFPIFIYS